MQFYILVIQLLPFRLLDAFADGPTNGMPVLVHERWPPLLCPTFVVWMKEPCIPASFLPSVSSPAPSRTTASGKSVLMLGRQHRERLQGLLQIANVYCLMLVHLPSSSTCFVLGGPQPTFPADCDLPSAGSPRALSALIKWSHTPRGGACARKTFASRRSVLPCMTKIPFGFLQSYCRHMQHTTSCTASSFFSSSSCYCRPDETTSCSSQTGTDDSGGTRSTTM